MIATISICGKFLAFHCNLKNFELYTFLQDILLYLCQDHNTQLILAFFVSLLLCSGILRDSTTSNQSNINHYNLQL